MQKLVGRCAHLVGLGQGACYGVCGVGQACVVGLARLVVKRVDALRHLQQALAPHDVAAAEVLQQRHAAFGHLLRVGHIVHARHDVHLVKLLHRELCGSVVGAQRIHAVVEKLHAVGQVGGVGEHVHDAAAHGVLAGFHNEVFALEAHLLQPVHHLPHVSVFAAAQVQRVCRQRVAAYDLLAQRLGVAHHHHGLAAAHGFQHLAAHQHVGVLGLLGVIGVCLAVACWEEHHLLSVGQQRFEVVVEVEGVVLCGRHKQLVDSGLLGSESRRHDGWQRPRQAVDVQARPAALEPRGEVGHQRAVGI